MLSGVYWAKGDRADNQDSLVLEHVVTDRGECTLIVVADGIGSLDMGQTASGYAAECLVRWFYDDGIRQGCSPLWLIKRSLKRCVYDCHRELKEHAKKNNIKWGSTCSMVCIWDSHYVCLQLGDSQIWMNSKKNGLEQLTEIHVDNMGRLTRCLGSMRYDMPQIVSGHIGRKKGILVCSDGFMDRMSRKEVADSLAYCGRMNEKYIEKRLGSIGMENARRGSRDNRSAVYVVRDR